MNIILFDRPTYDRLYNCTMYTPEQWQLKRQPNVALGSFYIGLALIYQIAYIPFLIVMRKPEFIKHSAYKMMFYLGIVDVLATIDGGTLCGILYIRGDTFCTNQEFLYVVSCFTAAVWGCACMTGLLLIVNRAMDLLSPYYADVFFGGYKLFFWLIPPTLYGLFFLFFTKPFLFNSIMGALFLSPYAGIDEISVDIVDYENLWTVGNNLLVTVAYPLMYTFLCIVLVVKTRKSGTAKISLLQKQMILQSLLVCFLILVTAVIYMYMQYFYTPHVLIVTAHFTWQASHGGAVFAYIFINRSMRRGIIELLTNPLGKDQSKIKDISRASKVVLVSQAKSAPAP